MVCSIGFLSFVEGVDNQKTFILFLLLSEKPTRGQPFCKGPVVSIFGFESEKQNHRYHESTYRVI